MVGRRLFCCFSITALCIGQTFHPSVPKAWADSETKSFELPLAQADRSPRYPSEKEYYAQPVRPVYRTYPIYLPDKEPAGYWDSLQRKEPEVLFDSAKLATKDDWIRAGELVFDQPIVIVPPASRARYQDSLRDIPPPTSPEGIVPGWFYVIRKKGVVELGFGACAECHTRVMPNGSFLKGAQSNLPMARGKLWRQTHRSTPEPDAAFRQRASSREYTPWAQNQDNWDEMSQAELIHRWQAMPPGVLDREGASTRHPVKVPSLIGVGDLKYLDATGLSRNRDAGDLMRYSIVNQGLISFARYGDFEPKTPAQGGNTRYSDEQLYALTLFLYSLKAPPNPNLLNEEAKRGRTIFNREGCAGCHPAPLYTNNKLTPVRGFAVPDALRKTDAILELAVGTEPGLALETRRGTGFYKVPSLRGVWMRTAFGHEGQAAGLEEWFDPARLNADYVAKGFHLTPGPILGHAFGLKLSPSERKMLIAFLRTL